MVTYGELTEAGFCTMGPHHEDTTTLVFARNTHEVNIFGMAPFTCCEICAGEYAKLDNGDTIRVAVRDLSRGQA